MSSSLRRSSFLFVCIGLLIFSALSISGQSNHARKSQQPPQPGKRGVGSAIDDPPSQKQKQDKQDKEDITLNSDLVTVVAAVTGRDGNFVNDLKKEDFEIVEDNVPQALSGFSREDSIPLSIAFLFDTSGSVRERRDFEKRAAANFFKDVFRPQDHASIYLVNTEVERELAPTSRLEYIINAIGRIQVERGATALYDAIYFASQDLDQTNGRHVIMVLSDGRDNVSKYDLKKALAEAQNADAVVYAIHPYGRDLSANLRDPGAEQALISFAEQTGGEAYFSANVEELEQDFHRFAAELHAQYVLTYYSKNETRDGKFRTLSVNVRRPGLTVRSRKGYFAPK